MHCPFCSSEETKVTDSRPAPGKVRRRRECKECSARFTTYESPELRLPKLIKSNGRREAFDETKLRAGLERALEKRPVREEEIETAVADIIRALRGMEEREVPSRWVGELAMDALRKLDQVAYVRFASIYRSFEDLTEFESEIRRARRRGPKNDNQSDLFVD